MTAPDVVRTSTSSSIPPSSSPHRGKRITREELYRQRPDLRPADNDNRDIPSANAGHAMGENAKMNRLVSYQPADR